MRKSFGLGLVVALVGIFALALWPASQAQAVEGPTRYEQTHPHIVKTGTWGDFTKAEASDGSYGRSASVGASTTVYFNGTRCDWIGMTGITPGIVDVYLDGVKKATLDLYSSTARYQVLHWSSGELAEGDHVVRLVRSAKSSTGEFLVLDAFDIWGTISSTPAPILSDKDRAKASWLAGYLSGLGSRLAPYAAYICDVAYNYRVPLPLALSFFKDENYWWKESYCIAHPRSWLNKNIGNLGFRTWQVERYPGTVLESGYTYNRFAAFPTVECGIDAWFYTMRVRSSTYSAGVDMIWAGDVEGGLAKILYTYAPPSENDTAARVAAALSYYNTIAARMVAEDAFEPGPGVPTIPDPPPVPPVDPPLEPPPSGTPTRFEQTDGKIAYSGTWLNFTASGSSGGSYGYADSSASATIWFDGTRLDWIATKGYTQGKALVSLDGGDPVVVDLYNATTQRQVKVWSTGDIAAGTHTMTITWTGQRSVSTGGTRVNIDAVDVVGALCAAPSATLTRFEQTDGKIAYSGTWLSFTASGSSGGTYKYADSAASATITFDGTRLDWIATKGYTQGKALVSLDGGDPVVVDLYNATTQRQVKVWSTGDIAAGTHTMTITWTGQRSVSTGGTRVNIDAVDVVGALK